MIVEGIVQSIIFRNSNNGYTVLSVQTDEKKRTVTAVGVLPLLDVGDHVRLEGESSYHARFGEQFSVKRFERLAPSTTMQLEAYLSSGVVKGVGKAMAKTIVSHFGMETLMILEHEPHRLTEIRGIGEKKAAMISESFRENTQMRDVLLALEPYGVTVGQAYRMVKTYGDLCLAKIQENPYQLIEDIDGIGFLTADKIAQNVSGFETNSLARLMAGVRYALQHARDERGDMFLPYSDLLEQATQLLGADREMLEDTIDWMVEGGELILENVEEVQAVYLPYLAKMETYIAKKLLALCKKPTPQVWDLDGIEEKLNLTLSSEQRKAVKMALESGILIITGGPGTGKTTIIRLIANAMQQQGFDFALAAPTGRAAKRMNEATEFPASTLHRLLEYVPGEGFLRNQENPLLYDMLIVDEMSMVDAPLFYALLKALSSDTRLILVGDSDQLPPVGCGSVLLDAISSEQIPVCHLNEIFRQAQQSMIVQNAHRINRGERPILRQSESDFCFEEIGQTDLILRRLTQLVLHEQEKLMTTEPLMDVQVLVPMKSGPLGVVALNQHLQSVLNPQSSIKAEYAYGEHIYRVGDKIMQIKNDYRKEWRKRQAFGSFAEGSGVFNGDFGTIVAMDLSMKNATIVFDDGRIADYDFKEFDSIDHAYCITIHKSQGSEFSTVILPFFGGPPMLLTRNLLYTAVTRAKRMVYGIGRSETMLRMVANDRKNERNTGLKQRLIAYADCSTN